MRSLSKRQMVVSLHRQGDSQSKIAEAVGLSQSRVSQILKEERFGYRGGQWGGHKPCKLSEAQLLELEGYLSISAETEGYVGAHWDGRRIQALLSEKFGIQYHVSSIYRLLHQMSYSSQKYTTQDYRQDEQAVAHFVQETLPALKKKAILEDRLIFYLDEAGFNLTGKIGHTWAPVGCTPCLQTTCAYKRLSVVSAISPCGEFLYEIIEGSVKQDGIIDFLTRLYNTYKKK